MHATSEQAATLIWEALRQGTALAALPADCRPGTREQGYAVQACLAGLAGLDTVGWKIAATSLVGQRHIGVAGPLAGRILSGFVHGDGAVVSLEGNRMRVAEPEFGFFFGRDLPPRPDPYPVAVVLDAVQRVVPVIEAPNSRFADFAHAGEAQLIADLACAGHFLVGGETGARWRELDFPDHPVRGLVTHGGATVAQRDGTGAAVLGDPRVALAWLVNELSSLGITLRAGQFASTGTCMPPLEVQAGDTALADFGALGQVSVRFCR
jgi:2-keto-4-pentenoate hydratase